MCQTISPLLETPQWIKFFENAGLPPKIASKYSMLFQEHRIQRSMLADLTKAILNEIGINAVGDVLAILKQAKTVASTVSTIEFVQGHKSYGCFFRMKLNPSPFRQRHP